MTIAFIHSHKAFLPEIEAYSTFFSAYGIKTAVIYPEESISTKTNVEWHFMGTDSNKKENGIIKIHEYTSASIPPFRKWKDLYKRWFNTKPDYRLFLNEYVQSQFDFNDNIPFGFRDMGVATLFPQPGGDPSGKKYDFIYTGNINTERKIEKLIGCFTKNDLKEHSVLILSRDYEERAERFKAFKNIHFAGPVPQNEVKDHILKARFAINFMPDKEPFNQQTSTKLLEYAALNIPIITTDYAWIRNFQREYGGAFFYLEKDLSNFTWDRTCNFNYSFPDLSEWKWEKRIRKSGILEFLQSKFDSLNF